MIANSYNARQAAKAAATRKHLLDILAEALSPDTLVAVIQDLHSNDQLDGIDQEHANAAAEHFANQLSDMLGEEEAQRRVCGMPVGCTREAL